MSEAEQQERSHVGKWVMWTLLILIVYVLSAAPVEAIAWHHGWVWLIETNSTVYAPLDYCLKAVPPLNLWQDEYLDWWIEIFPPAPGFQ